jgi:hypothetical protein
MTVGIAMHVHGYAIHSKGQSCSIDLISSWTRHLMDTRVRVVEGNLARHRCGKGCGASDANLLHRCQHMRMGDVVQRAASVSRPPRSICFSR